LFFIFILHSAVDGDSETLPLVTATVAALGVPSHGLWRNFWRFAAWSEKHCPDTTAQHVLNYQTPHIGTNKSSAMSYCASKFFVAVSISKETPHIFVPKRWNRFFAIYVVRLALYVCLKNICDGVGCQNGSNGTPLDPPLFWLDNIFKGLIFLFKY
jgi:hypothetical protein